MAIGSGFASTVKIRVDIVFVSCANIEPSPPVRASPLKPIVIPMIWRRETPFSCLLNYFLLETAYIILHPPRTEETSSADESSARSSFDPDRFHVHKFADAEFAQLASIT